LRLAACLLPVFLLAGCGTHVYHQVREGDTLYSISFHYKQNFQKVAKWNGLTPPYTIHKGQWLRVAPPTPEGGFAPPVYQRSQQAGSVNKHISDAENDGAAAAKHPLPKVSSIAPAQVPVKDWAWPVKGKIIRKFAANTPGKQGIDIAGKAGTLVRAAAAGKVVYSGNGLRGYGNLLIIKHNERFLSAYAHNQALLVKEGATVKQGDAIARMGSTESKRVELHFQIRVDGQPVDPLRYLPK